MRTIEEVKAFIESYRFIHSDAERIMGFLLGKGVIEKGTVIVFSSNPKELATFDEFYSWFEGDFKQLEGLLNFLQDEQDKAIAKGNMDKANELAGYLGFLVDALELEYDVVEDENEDA